MFSMEIFHTLLSGLGSNLYRVYAKCKKLQQAINIEGFITVFLESYCTVYLH
jgi:hypothetical protein